MECEALVVSRPVMTALLFAIQNDVTLNCLLLTWIAKASKKKGNIIICLSRTKIFWDFSLNFEIRSVKFMYSDGRSRFGRMEETQFQLFKSQRVVS
jgi:hypothetical protein